MLKVAKFTVWYISLFIQKHGVPRVFMRNYNRVKVIDPNVLASVTDAVQVYQQADSEKNILEILTKLQLIH